MKKGIVRIVVVMCVCVLTPYIGLNITKADDGVTTDTPDTYETKNATVVSSALLSDGSYSVYVIQDDDNGIYYTVTLSNSIATFNINDNVVICIQKTSKGKVIVRDIVRR